MTIGGKDISIGNWLMVLGMICALAASWYVWGEQKGRLDQRVDQVERRQQEDRTEIKRQLERIEERSERTERTVQDIRILLEGIRQEQERGRQRLGK